MAHRHAAFGTLLRTVGRAIDTRPDERLLADFYTHRDEVAFTTLVRRHQRTVWTVCARVLNEPADAEDAFQATFLVLARSGRMLADRGSVGGWLYRVAERVARKARTMAINRKRYERRAGRSEAATVEYPADGELFAIVSAELDRLPEHHRLAIILCDLDGLSRADAATRLGWNEGTLSARLHRGRKQLADRLRARGIAPAVGLAAVLATPLAVPAQVAANTAALARTVMEVGLTNRAVPATVAALVSQTTREMAMRITTKVLATITLAAGMIGFGWFGLPGGTEPRANAAPVPETKRESKPDVSPSALQLLRNRKVLRELKCTPEQRVTIEDHFDDQAEANQAKGGDVVDIALVPGGNPNAVLEQLEAKMKARQEAEAAETKTAAEKVLKSAQLLRLTEIDLQVRGAEAFTDPKVADALKLTDDQKKAVSEAIDEGKGNRNVGGFQAVPPPPVPGGIAVARAGVWTTGAFDPKARKATYEKAEEALTKEQKATWKKMIGEEVKAFDPHAMWVNRGTIGGSIRVGVPAFAPAMPVVPGVPLPVAPLPPKKDER